MTEQEQVVSSADAPSSFSADAFDTFLARIGTTASEGGAPTGIRRREAVVEVDHRLCEPDAFDEPIKLSIISLNSTDELEAMRSAGDGQAVAHSMAKMALVAVNGRRLREHEKGLLWEALGFSGRVVVANAFLKHCTGADEELLGKSLDAVEVG